MNEDSESKRKHESEADSDGEDFVGPSLSEALLPKKRKTLPYEKIYLENLPSADSYEKSYMHRDVITHCIVTNSDFLVTASCDGHIKFWKKVETGIEFVKHFRSHLGPIVSLSSNTEGSLLCSASSDKSLKIFDVINFDMINIMRLEYVPGHAQFIHTPGDAIHTLAVTDSESPNIYIYDSRGNNTPMSVLDRVHTKSVCLIKYNSRFDTVVSVDKNGILGECDFLRH